MVLSVTVESPLRVTLSLILTDCALLLPLWETVLEPESEEEDELEDEVEAVLPVLRTLPSCEDEPLLVSWEEPVLLLTVVALLPEEEPVLRLTVVLWELPEEELEELPLVVLRTVMLELSEVLLPVDLLVVWPLEELVLLPVVLLVVWLLPEEEPELFVELLLEELLRLVT